MRRVTTLGTLSGAPDGVVILTAHGRVMQHKAPYWKSPGSMTDYTPIVDWLPAIVLHEPTYIDCTCEVMEETPYNRPIARRIPTPDCPKHWHN